MRGSDLLKMTLIAAGLATGCNGGGTAGTSGTGAGNRTSGTKVSVCEKCEDPAEFYKKVTLPNQLPSANLKPGEMKSLTDALPAAASAGAKAPHLHAEVVNGELVFHADNDASHAANTQLGMVVEKSGGGAPQPVRVVATPEAADLLHKRTE